MDKPDMFFNRRDRLSQDLTRRKFAYTRIKDAIRNSQLKPGEPLTETRLSKLLGISRTSVREALQQLVQEGLAESIPGHAVTVANRTIQDLLDVLHIRSLLEPEQARLVAEAITDEQLEALETVAEKLVRTAQRHDLLHRAVEEAAYHELLKEACPNRLLSETVIKLKTRVHHMANIDTQTDPARLEGLHRGAPGGGRGPQDQGRELGQGGHGGSHRRSNQQPAQANQLPMSELQSLRNGTTKRGSR